MYDFENIFCTSVPILHIVVTFLKRSKYTNNCESVKWFCSVSSTPPLIVNRKWQFKALLGKMGLNLYFRLLSIIYNIVIEYLL